MKDEDYEVFGRYKSGESICQICDEKWMSMVLSPWPFHCPRCDPDNDYNGERHFIWNHGFETGLAIGRKHEQLDARQGNSA